MAGKKATAKVSPKNRALVLGGICLLLIYAFGQEGLKTYLFYPPAPSPDYPVPAHETEARIQDLDYLEKYVRGYDRSFSTKARGKALQLIREYQALSLRALMSRSYWDFCLLPSPTLHVASILVYTNTVEHKAL